MSSVLLGIIGITLFIGIAVSGAVFLGPKFEDAQIKATAANALQAVASVASAANQFRFAKNYAAGAGMADPAVLVSEGFIRTLPSDPTGNGAQVEIVDAQGADIGEASDPVTYAPRYIFLSLGADRELCTEIERSQSTIAPSAQVSTQQRNIADFNARPAGCFRVNTGSSRRQAGDYVAFARI